jgi:hypothetical protein
MNCPSKCLQIGYLIYNYNSGVCLCVWRRFRVLIDWRNQLGQSDFETGNRPGQSDSANQKSPTKNRGPTGGVGRAGKGWGGTGRGEGEGGGRAGGREGGGTGGEGEGGGPILEHF